MRVLRLAIPSSPSKSVVLSAIYREVLADGVPAEVHIISDSGPEAFRAVRDVFSKLEWSDTEVTLHGVSGVSEWFTALDGLDVDVVDVTPGRKVHALALYAQAAGSGARVRYSYLIDERRFGYMYPGYAPPYAVRLLEIHPELRDLGYGIPEALEQGSWEGDVTAKELHALINTTRTRWSDLRLAARGVNLRIDVSKEPFSVTQAEGLGAGACLSYASAPANIWDAVGEVRACARRRCAIALDTSALMAGMNEFLARVVPGYGSLVRHLGPVMGEVMNFLEMKHSWEGIGRKLAYLDALAAGDAVAPGRARAWGRGDKAIIAALNDVIASHACTCFITADRNLADALRARGNVKVILLRHSRDPNLVEESLIRLVRCVALAGKASISAGRLRIRLGEASMIGGEVRVQASMKSYGRLAALVTALVMASLSRNAQ